MVEIIRFAMFFNFYLRNGMCVPQYGTVHFCSWNTVAECQVGVALLVGTCVFIYKYGCFIYPYWENKRVAGYWLKHIFHILVITKIDSDKD